MILLDSITPPGPRLQHRDAVERQGADRRCRRQRAAAPKRFFGAARNIEEGGSLTIIATALIDTGSRMDDVIYEEFKGTGNMEIHMDRRMAEKACLPGDQHRPLGHPPRRAAARTKRAAKDLDPAQAVLEMDEIEAMEKLQKHMRETKNNKEFFEAMTQARASSAGTIPARLACS